MNGYNAARSALRVLGASSRRATANLPAMSASTAESLAGERLAPANGIELAYEELGDPAGEPILLIMGLATQMIYWDEAFCALLGGARLPGDPLRQPRHRPLDQARLGGDARTAPMLLGHGRPAYRLTDMATTPSALLDHLEIERRTWSAPRWAG